MPYTLLYANNQPLTSKPIKSRHFDYEHLIGYTTPQRYSDPILADRPREFYQKKFFRVALARFGSFSAVTPAPLHALYAYRGGFGCAMFITTPKHPEKMPEIVQKSKSSIFEQLNSLKIRHLHT